MSDLPGYVWTVVVIGVIGFPAVTTILFRNTVVAAVWGGWVVASVLLAAAGVYRQDPVSVQPWIGVALLGAVVVLLATTRIPSVSRRLAEPGALAWLTLPQTFRVVGGIFLLVWAMGELPAAFAVPAGLGDIAIGVSAPFVARHATRRGAIWFNILGLLDLLVAVTTATLSGLGPARLLTVTPSSELIGLLPLVLIPTTAVPLAIVLHLLSLSRLRARTVTTAGSPDRAGSR